MKTQSLFRLFAPLLVLVAVTAHGSVARADTKIGYFDVKRILAEVDEAKSAKDKLQRAFGEKQKALDAKRDELEKMQRDIEQKAAVLSQTAKQQLAMEFQQKLVEANKLYGELQTDLAQQEQRALGELLGRLEPVVSDIAKAEGYAYVFEKNESGLFYAPAGHDLTAQIIRRYNERFPAAGKATKGKSK